MAKYIKFNLTAPGATTGSELLINIDQITRIATASTTTTDIFFDNNVTATKKWRVTHLVPLVANDVLNAIQAAMTANPGGVSSQVQLALDGGGVRGTDSQMYFVQASFDSSNTI